VAGGNLPQRGIGSPPGPPGPDTDGTAKNITGTHHGAASGAEESLVAGAGGPRGLSFLDCNPRRRKGIHMSPPGRRRRLFAPSWGKPVLLVFGGGPLLPLGPKKLGRRNRRLPAARIAFLDGRVALGPDPFSGWAARKLLLGRRMEGPFLLLSVVVGPWILPNQYQEGFQGPWVRSRHVGHHTAKQTTVMRGSTAEKTESKKIRTVPSLLYGD